MKDDHLNTNETNEDNGGCCSEESCCAPPSPVVRAGAKIGRNDPCFCGSGRKFKKCCGQ